MGPLKLISQKAPKGWPENRGVRETVSGEDQTPCPPGKKRLGGGPGGGKVGRSLTHSDGYPRWRASGKREGQLSFRGVRVRRSGPSRWAKGCNRTPGTREKQTWEMLILRFDKWVSYEDQAAPALSCQKKG